MNVRLAAQLLSRSVAIGLKFYREQGEPDFEGTEGTEMFTLLTNDLFDTLNAKCPMEGIRRNSPKIKVIRDFLDLVDTTEKNSVRENTRMFASQQTIESLRVTLMSVLDVISHLHNKEVVYVLTAKLNQDPLERFFGVVRNFGGDEDHPTITHFSQIFRLLSLYTPLKMATKGNCSVRNDTFREIACVVYPGDYTGASFDYPPAWYCALRGRASTMVNESNGSPTLKQPSGYIRLQ
ncbi:hypothetical protein MTO96_006055 [Rhipicephalus appendiculatus]